MTNRGPESHWCGIHHNVRMVSGKDWAEGTGPLMHGNNFVCWLCNAPPALVEFLS